MKVKENFTSLLKKHFSMRKSKSIKIIRAGNKAMFLKKPPLRISWHLTRMCNYSCSYCMQSKKSSHPASVVDTLRAAKNILPLFRDEKVRISFYGGEPLIHPALLDIVKFYRDELNDNCKLMAQTNGNRSISFFHKLFAIDPTFHINNSVHLESVDESNLLDKIDVFCENNRRPKINIMLLPDYRDKAKRICDSLLLKRENLSFRFDISLVRSPESKYKKLLNSYTESDLLWRDEMMMAFEEKKFNRKKNITNGDPLLFIDYAIESKKTYRLVTRYSEALRHNLLSFKGMNCILGHRLILDVNGFLRMPCASKSIGNANVYEKKLSDSDYLKNVKCPKYQCLCKADVTSPKYSAEVHAPRYFLEAHNYEMNAEDIKPISIDWVLHNLST